MKKETYKAQLKRELQKLKKARTKSKDKGFVMDTFQYEDQLKEDLKRLGVD